MKKSKLTMDEFEEKLKKLDSNLYHELDVFERELGGAEYYELLPYSSTAISHEGYCVIRFKDGFCYAMYQKSGFDIIVFNTLKRFKEHHISYLNDMEDQYAKNIEVIKDIKKGDRIRKILGPEEKEGM